MSKYYFLNWIINNEDEQEFIFNDYYNKGFLLIAESLSNYSIYRLGSIDDNNLPEGVEKLPIELEILLQCAEGYLPVIALARDEIIKICEKKKPIQKQEFSKIYSMLLKKHLEEQPYKSYFLSEFLSDNSDEFSKGQFVWIIGYEPIDKMVICISNLYFINRYPAKFFKLELALLQKLSSNSFL